MTATNHALTGTVIGLASGNPVLAMPMALLSHFVCDALPHYGAGKDVIGSSGFKKLLVADAAGCLIIVASLAIFQPQFWLLAAVCAFLAASPDFMWINKFRKAQRGQPDKESSAWLLRFHAGIQWYEKPSGAFFELLWATGAIILLKHFIV